jgi:hypothetical protein
MQMIDTTPDETSNDLKYTDKGILIGPSPAGKFSGFLAIATPVIVILDKWNAPFPPLFLPSDHQVANVEFLLECLLFAEIAGSFQFFRSYTKKYSRQKPPPVSLKLVWPRQCKLAIAIGAGSFFLPFLVGSSIHSGLQQDFLTPITTFGALFCLSAGLYLLAEGLLSASLYGYFFLKYWRGAD